MGMNFLMRNSTRQEHSSFRCSVAMPLCHSVFQHAYRIIIVYYSHFISYIYRIFKALILSYLYVLIQ